MVDLCEAEMHLCRQVFPNSVLSQVFYQVDFGTLGRLVFFSAFSNLLRFFSTE